MPEPALISTRADLDRAIEASRVHPVMLFKHSVSCGISSALRDVYREFVASRPAGDAAQYTEIEIQNAREISNEIAEHTGVRHESPQTILLKDGQAVWNASHWDISRESLEGALASVAAR